MRYLIVIPTIRQEVEGFNATIEAVRESLTQPTDLRILDGKAGKSQTLNAAYDELLSRFEGDVYVTLDDDLIPPHGWQDRVDDAFGLLPDVGMVSLWLGDRPVERNYMGAEHVGPENFAGEVRYRLVLGNHHIPGYMLAFRKEVAVSVGKLPESDLKYQIWEDAWRGRRVLKQGFRLAYVVTNPPPRLVQYRDDEAYVAAKERELAEGRKVEDVMLDSGGVGNSLLLKLRKRIARWRGRA